ncbi:hypothetical protein M0638_27485 [Roseomonas sp. NAR14]|uniref:VCBS repeat-containing protein n=1 Tax=Roseomonas acroporae TaxID=2937791 RepID=A0A9X1YG67_9PROT|nr:hypothetical protein [Roseomonas acroporae]MCK8788102.1 hypothetical protein [Roseomonas acroporae]
MSGAQIVGGGVIAQLSPDWSIKGVADFNGDGHSDILLQKADGLLALWEMDGANVIGGGRSVI